MSKYIVEYASGPRFLICFAISNLRYVSNCDCQRSWTKIWWLQRTW